jgi:HK97 family phage major capsid protein
VATYNSLTSRTEAAALIPEDVSQEILGDIAGESAVMALGRRLPDMARAQRRVPVWSALPTAYFVDGDTGLKQTTEAAWSNVYLNVEELAVIVPIAEAVLDDADYDLFGEIRPAIVSAIGAAFDQAVLYGINAPASWPECIIETAEFAGHEVTLNVSYSDLFDDIFAENGVIAKVEEDGYMVNGHIAALSLRAKLRGLKDTTGQPIFMSSLQENTQYALDGERLIFPTNGAIDPSRALLISGDWNQLVWAVRKDITYKVLTEAVIQDGNGAIQYNLAQQDMVALRVVFRVAWQVPNPINRVNTSSTTRYPFAFLEPFQAS